MAERSFKNIGTTTTQLQVSRPAAQTFPIGIKTPMEFGGNGNPYKMHTSVPDQINDNLRNMILTNRGERLGKYDYGANLRQILADFPLLIFPFFNSNHGQLKYNDHFGETSTFFRWCCWLPNIVVIFFYKCSKPAVRLR